MREDMPAHGAARLHAGGECVHHGGKARISEHGINSGRLGLLAGHGDLLAMLTVEWRLRQKR
jgi:hypothetical protein